MHRPGDCKVTALSHLLFMMKQEEEKPRKAFKDWFDRDAVRLLADQISSASTEFDRKRFLRIAVKGLGDLEFHGRVKHLSEAIRECLPGDIPTALDILTRSLPPAQQDCESVTDGWLQWPVGQWIADHGIDHFEMSMTAMIALTQRFTSEFAVRPFVERYPDRVFPELLRLAGHENPHVRRWCSEGIRTRLPWGRKLHSLIENPAPIFPILEQLKDDSEEYVRRSVANNLNDIAKDHPDLVIKTCRAWNKGADENRKRLIRHALRTLVKDGRADALAILGFHPPGNLKATLEVNPPSIAIGESVALNAKIKNEGKRSTALMIDYAVHYVRKADKVSAKVFKWKTLKIAAGEELEITKQHAMKQTSVRALYPGSHLLELQVNGVRLAATEFELR